jgi:hypothetical protein
MWNPGYTVVKVNAKSMYVWYESRFTDAFIIQAYELVEGNGTYHVYDVKTSPLYE